MNRFFFDIPTLCFSNKRFSTIQSRSDWSVCVNLVKQMLKVLVVGMVLISLAACTLFSNDGYHGGDHRSGGPTEPLRQ